MNGYKKGGQITDKKINDLENKLQEKQKAIDSL